jgi:hypothetical protein
MSVSDDRMAREGWALIIWVACRIDPLKIVAGRGPE